jgi:hypothetical protein
LVREMGGSKDGRDDDVFLDGGMGRLVSFGFEGGGSGSDETTGDGRGGGEGESSAEEGGDSARSCTPRERGEGGTENGCSEHLDLFRWKCRRRRRERKRRDRSRFLGMASAKGTSLLCQSFASQGTVLDTEHPYALATTLEVNEKPSCI